MGIHYYYYLHKDGSLIKKDDAPGVVADLMESSFVQQYWRLDTCRREQAWILCIEALAAGADAARIRSLAEHWGLDDEDGKAFANLTDFQVRRWRSGWLAQFPIKGSRVGTGTTILEALADLIRPQVRATAKGEVLRLQPELATEECCCHRVAEVSRLLAPYMHRTARVQSTQWERGATANLTTRRAIFVYEGAILAARAAGAPIVPEPWMHRDEAFRTQFCEAIERQCGPDRKSSAKELHEDWVKAYEAMGWKHGPVRDVATMTHPDMVPYKELGQLERDKDDVFVALCEIARQWIREE